MKPAPFEYIAPRTLAEALAVLAEHGDDAKLLAGGQSLIPVMNFRLAQPTLIVDLNPVQELATLHANSSVHIGAMVRQSRLERSATIAKHAPLLHTTMPYIAHPQIRNRGTIGGSLAHADPAGELPVIAVARQARFLLKSVRGERWVNATDFYVGLFMTNIEPDEILTEIVFPTFPKNTGFAFQELARRHGDYAQAGVAALVTIEAEIVTNARLVYLNVGDVPMVASKAAGMMVGERVSADLVAAVAHTATQEEIAPTGDVHGSAEYKRHLAKVLTVRALDEAVERMTRRV